MYIKTLIKNYNNIILLFIGIVVGAICGLIFREKTYIVKPIGDIFLNLIFTIIIPLIFFAITSAIATINKDENFGVIIKNMLLVFFVTSLIATFFMLISLYIFPLHNTSIDSQINYVIDENQRNIGEQLTKLLSTDVFFQVFSRENMLALIVFSTIVGIATFKVGDKAESFKNFLVSGSEVMKEAMVFIMKAAPIGLGAYFANFVGNFGYNFLKMYAESLILIYGSGLFYFIFFYSLYAFIAAGIKGVKNYWRYSLSPSITALGTCSSVAAIAGNMDAANKMGIPKKISDIVIPFGATLHKDGSAIGAIAKIGLIFAILNKPIGTWEAIIIAIVIALVTVIVEGGIPNGGYIGEIFVVTAYGLPIELLSILMILSTLMDPILTLINSGGDTAAALLVNKLLTGKNKPQCQEIANSRP
ncbi:MAG: dicarboxylate/amino acid:cation symporter [Solitalea-like symbiont of Tyrophagus putrescentiae]